MSFVDVAITNYFEGKRRAYPQHTNRVSQAGIECARRLQWHRSKWEIAKLPPTDLQRRFELGNVFETAIRRVVEDSGIPFQLSQRDLRWPELELTGHIDGVMLTPPDDQPLIAEFKSASRFAFEAVRKAGRTAAALLASPKAYIRGYVVQAGLYAKGMDFRGALVIFVCKDSFETHTVEVMLDDPDVAEAILAAESRFRAVNQAIKEERDLPPEPGSYCKECPFLTACLPNRDFGAGISVMDDLELEGRIARRLELKPAASEFKEIDEELKEVFSAPGDFVAGPFSVTVKAGETTVYTLPNEIKATYAKKVPQLRRSYVRFDAEASPASESKDSIDSAKAS